MSLINQLVNRGRAVMREWHNSSELDESSKRMIAELGATMLIDLCGNNICDISPEERADKANAVRIALTSAFQIGKNIRVKTRHKKKKDV